jgi:ABC-2 type transport system permease protein
MGIIFANIVAIYRKELQSYFASPIAYIIAGIFWLLAGFFFINGIDGVINASIGRDLQVEVSGQEVPPFDAPYELLRYFLGLMGSLSLFFLPMLSMGLYAEERKRGTLELLATSPLTNWAVAVGKLLGVVTFFITMLMPLLVYEAIAFSASTPPILPAVLLLGHAGLILLAAAVLSLGMFISSLTDSSILAAFLTFASILFLWVIDAIANSLNNPIGETLRHLSLLKHYNNLIQGVVDSSSLVLFGSYIILGVFLTAQAIEALRFQRS